MTYTHTHTHKKSGSPDMSSSSKYGCSCKRNPTIVDIFGMTKYCIKHAMISRLAYHIANGFIWIRNVFCLCGDSDVGNINTYRINNGTVLQRFGNDSCKKGIDHFRLTCHCLENTIQYNLSRHSYDRNPEGWGTCLTGVGYSPQPFQTIHFSCLDYVWSQTETIFVNVWTPH